MARSNRYPLICLLVAFSLVEFVLSIGHELLVIEKSPNGLFVGTSEHTYAFTHPDLAECNWSSVSLRKEHVLIVKQDNSTSFRLWEELDESERDLISDSRSDFISNLAGLRLTYLSRPSKQYNKPAKQQVKSNNYNKNNNGYESLRSPTYVASGAAASSRYNKPSLSSNSAYGPRRQHQKYSQASSYHRGPGASTSYSSKAGISGGGRFKAKKQPQTASTKYATSNYYNKVTAAAAAAAAATTAADDDESDERQPSTYGSDTTTTATSTSGTGSGGSSSSYGSSGSLSSFNYYNVQQSELKKKLAGDVYHFDMDGNILDVFSSTISIRLEQKLQRKTSILYRDTNFFSYASSSLPSAISRLFVKNEFAFFVHKDSTVFVKPIHLLDSKEKKLVYKAKAQVKKLAQWQTLPSGYTFALPTESPANEQSASNNNITTVSPINPTDPATYQSGEAISATTTTASETTQIPEQLETTQPEAQTED